MLMHITDPELSQNYPVFIIIFLVHFKLASNLALQECSKTNLTRLAVFINLSKTNSSKVNLSKILKRCQFIKNKTDQSQNCQKIITREPNLTPNTILKQLTEPKQTK